MFLLILSPSAEDYRKALEHKFPRISIHAAATEEEIGEFIRRAMLALDRNLPRSIRNHDQKIWERWPGKVLYGKKVGILGVGAVA